MDSRSDLDVVKSVLVALSELGVGSASDLLARITTNMKPLCVDEVRFDPAVERAIADTRTARTVLHNKVLDVLQTNGLIRWTKGKTIRMYPTPKALRIGKVLIEMGT